MSTFSPSEAAFEGFRLFRARPVSVFIWGLLPAILLALIAAVLWMLIGPQLQQAILNSPRNVSGINNQINVGTGPASIFIDCAIFRAMLRPSQRSFASLRFSGDELRVFAVSIVLGLIFCAAVLVGVLITAVPIVILSHNGGSGPAAAVVLGVLVGLAALIAFFWVAVRLCLASTITFAQRRIAPFASWRLTKGHFWNLLGTALLSWLLCMLAFFAIIVAAGVLCLLILSPVLANLMGGTPDYGHATPFLIGAGVVGAAAFILLLGLQRAIMIAPLAYVYRALTGDQTGEADPVLAAEPGPTSAGVLVL